MCSCAPGFSLADSFSNDRVVALELVKKYTEDNIVCITPKVYEVESRNLKELLVSMCSLATMALFLDLFSRVIAHDLVKNCHFHLVVQSFKCLS